MIRSRDFAIGVGICALLGLLDIVGLAGINAKDAPPPPVVTGGAALGLITLAGALLVWRDRRGGMATVVVSRALSAFLAMPVFFVDNAPNWARVIVAIGIALTVVAFWLFYGARRQPQISAAGGRDATKR
jgi:O-antigen/teichoic acid export membrane protein